MKAIVFQVTSIIREPSTGIEYVTFSDITKRRIVFSVYIQDSRLLGYYILEGEYELVRKGISKDTRK